MKVTIGVIAALLLAGPSVSYFKYERPVSAAGSGGQHYFIVDASIWQHARPDLSDLRLYSGNSEAPYALEVERGGSETEQKEFRVLQPATVGGKTQFLLDMSDVPEYDRVTLKLATENFVAHARVEGQDDPHGAHWALLGTTTLYDLSAEHLGHNSTLQMPIATYKFLRVTIDGTVKPSDVQSGTAGVTRAQKAVWRTISNQSKQEQRDKDTVLTFSVLQGVPVERVVFAIDPAQPNFRRDVELLGSEGQPLSLGEISRIHMQRGGEKIDVEQTSIEFDTLGQTSFKVLVHNGDDQPLKITDASLQQYERRIYFNSAPGMPLTLYYGDEKLEAPVYDYAKLFQKDAGASQLELGAESANVAYTGRPDERPWSERHPALLWAAIIAAVLVLGALALKSMRGASA
ncbi:MAG TPA: DUF3999 family protein [Methylomirabilota bacterium]|jgi:hypothetical protein|nr:DUF3999 family protein [Methylomirabilota bacterium]